MKHGALVIVITISYLTASGCGVENLRGDKTESAISGSQNSNPDSDKTDSSSSSASGEWSICNYTDDPDCWSCMFDEGRKKHCIQLGPLYPNQSRTWQCWDNKGERFCKDSSDSPVESNANWDCTFVEGQGNTCTKKTADLPDKEREWDCHDEGGARYCDEATLCEYSAIIGTICDLNGQTLAGITITATADPECSDGATLSTATDGTGNFELSYVPVGTVQLTISRNGVTSSHTVTLAKGDVTKFIDDNCSRQQGEPDAGQDTFVDTPDAYVPVIDEPDTSAPDTEPDVPEPPCQYGNVTGRICSPNGILWLNDATVYIDLPAYCGQPARRVQTLTDADGRFVLADIPVGTRTLMVEKGSFNTTYEVTITADNTYNIAEGVCLEQPRIAVVQGSYDAIQSVLDALSLDYTLFSDVDGTAPNSVRQLLNGSYATNPTHRLRDFDVVFFNCGYRSNNTYFLSTATVQQNLRNYLQDGHSIYASDYAYTLIRLVVGTEISAERYGNAQLIPDNEILTDPLETFIGRESVDINYDLPSWYVILTLGSSFTQHIVGNHHDCYYAFVGSVWSYVCSDFTNNPLLVSHQYGLGKLIYTTFHHEANMTPDMNNILKWLVFEL